MTKRKKHASRSTNNNRPPCPMCHFLLRIIAGILVPIILTLSTLLVMCIIKLHDVRKSLGDFVANTSLPNLEMWEEKHGETLIQFQVVDRETAEGISQARIVGRSIDVRTGQIGLTTQIMVRLGDEFLVEKDGFHGREVVIRKSDIESRYRKVKLSRLN